jgi:predicted glycoside hydrolase/deacetylase ChbG (UPF0249 family)
MTQTTNQLLGYPDDARLLLLNCDDFGMCHSNNAATLQALTAGIATSASIMMPCPAAPEAVQILRDHPDLPFAVHLTLVSEFPGYRWGPVAPAERVSTLIDESGKLYAYDQIPALLERATLDQVEIEYRAQIDALINTGLTPSHLDWHCIPDGGRQDIFDLTFRLAREYGLALRVHEIDHRERCHRERLPAHNHPVVDSYHLGSATKPQVFRDMLRVLPPGLTEWAVHPSLGNAESQAIEPDTWQIRKADFDFLVSEESRELIAEEGITLLDYRPLQAIWNGA